MLLLLNVLELMQESRLTNQQRNKLNYTLRSNDPLPSLASSKSDLNKNKSSEDVEIITKPLNLSQRRNYSSIIKSGAYEREKYVPRNRGVDRESAKQHLQDAMAFGKDIKHKPPSPKKPKEEPKINRFDERMLLHILIVYLFFTYKIIFTSVKQEIIERTDWLKEMEQLGEAHKYQTVIEQQIAARIREMKTLQPAP